MATKVGEFFVDLLVDAASGNLSVKQLVGALGELDVASVTSVGIVRKITEGLWGLAKAATGTSVELSALSATTGVNPHLIEQWDKAAEQVTHRSGSIVKAIEAVQAMNRNLKFSGPPPELGGLLDTSPYKRDDKGNQIPKDAIDYLKEFAAPGSAYRRLDRDAQQKALAGPFGGASQDAFLMLKALIDKTFPDPGKIRVLSNEQISGLTKVDSDWIKVKQDVVGIFDKFLTAGGMVDNILKGADILLNFIGKFLDLVEKRGAAPSVNPTTGAQGGVNIPYPGAMLAKELENKAKAATAAAEQKGGGTNRIAVDILHNGREKTRTYVEMSPTRDEFFNLSFELGNTP